MSRWGDDRPRSILFGGGRCGWLIARAVILFVFICAFAPPAPGPAYGAKSLDGIALWSYSVKSRTLSAPVSAANTIYVGGESALYAIDERSGKLKWEFSAPGARNFLTPHIAGQLLLATSGGPWLYALDASSGKLRWSFKPGGRTLSPPASDGESAFFGSDDKSLYCVDLSTGKLRWKFETQRLVYVKPAATKEGVVYFASVDGGLYSLGAKTGRLLWKLKPGWDYLIGQPIVVGDSIYAAAYNDSIYAVDAKTGRVKWNILAGNYITAPPIYSEGLLYFASAEGNAYAAEAATGKTLWKRPGPWAYLTSAAGVVSGILIAGSLEKKLFAIDAKSGAVLAEFDSGHYPPSIPLISGGKLFFWKEGGTMVAIDLGQLIKSIK